MSINTFSDLQHFIDKVLADNGDTGILAGSPHGAFWNTMSYEDFVSETGTIPNTGVSPILVKLHPEQSNLIAALEGTGIFDGNQMPPGGTPFTKDQIQQIADWIKAGANK